MTNNRTKGGMKKKIIGCNFDCLSLIQLEWRLTLKTYGRPCALTHRVYGPNKVVCIKSCGGFGLLDPNLGASLGRPTQTLWQNGPWLSGPNSHYGDGFRSTAPHLPQFTPKKWGGVHKPCTPLLVERTCINGEIRKIDWIVGGLALYITRLSLGLHLRMPLYLAWLFVAPTIK